MTEQHKKPCHDCPWRRNSAEGWLGSLSAEEWMSIAIGEGSAECHTELSDTSCAGLAIFRANICKIPRDPNALRLPADHDGVFSVPWQFMEHHDMEGNFDDE